MEYVKNSLKKNITKVYRVQNPRTGLGPYQMFNDSWTDRRHDAPTHPIPRDDRGLSRAWRYLCESKSWNDFVFGFESMDSLTAWFDKTELERLHALGFKIIEIDVSQIEAIAIGDKQLAYKLKKEYQNDTLL
jgi:hypothetical protein